MAMFKTDAEIRRFINLQLMTVKDTPDILKNKYSNYVSSVADDRQISFILSFKQWLIN
tara:strand:+ start:76 stop:249 length:174 start_codon:yes stop_codon:yes gene_type:complete